MSQRIDIDLYKYTAVIPKVRQTVAKVQQKLDKDLKCPFDNYCSPHINILKIEMGFSANSS
jgi:hypothetical protein